MEKDKLTFDINACAMKIHNTFGKGFTHAKFIYYGIREAPQFKKLYIKLV